MDHEAASRLFFEALHVVAYDEANRVRPDDARRRRSRPPLPEDGREPRLPDTIAIGQLVALVTTLCLGEVQCCLDPDDEIAIEDAIQCRHCAPIARGALLRISGWVERLGDVEVVFRVQAYDEQERVCDSTLAILVVRRREIAHRIGRKRAAIARRELFAAA